MKRVLRGGSILPLGLSMLAIALLLCTTLGVQPAKAELYAKIQGTVTDPTGAVLNGVKLTATNVGTNIPFSAETHADGNYVFLNLPIGTYRVTATSAGFRTFTATGITLVLDQVYALNIKMELGQVSEQVLVEASNVQVETTSTQLGTVINGDTIVDMPLNGRNWTQLQLLQPGVMGSADRFGTFSTNGSQSQQNSFLINGQDSNDLPLNTPLIIPSPDAIAEFSMVTNTINPEYGRNSGAILNAAIKSGTNHFHGSGFDFYRDTFLNTKDYFTHKAAIFHQNQFGGTIGGPVYKDHTFFFFSYQGSRFRQPQASSQNTLLTDAQRGGDFGAGAFDGAPGPKPDAVTGKCPASNPTCAPSNPNVSPVAMFGDASSPCPVSGEVMCAAGTYFGKAFDNSGALITNGLFSTGVIPSQDLNSIALNLMNKFVPTSAQAGGLLFTPVAVTAGKADQYIWQVDHTFNSKDSIRSYGFIQSNPTQDTLPFTGSSLPGFPEQAQRHAKQFTASWNHVFNPNVLNEARFGYTRFNFVAVEPVTPVLPSSVGFSITPQLGGANAGLPVVSLLGLFTLGFSNNGPQPRIDQVYQADDNFSYVVGRHTLKFGFDGRRFHVSNPFANRNNGSFTFNGSGQFSTANPAADFLLGIPDSYGQGSGSFIDAGTQAFYSYAQDSWKATSNLTVNYGVGWQINSPTTDHFNNGRSINCFRPGQQSAIYPTAPTGLVFPGDNGCTSSGYSTGFKHFGPRLGAAWAPHASGMLGRLTGDQGKFSIRAGVGMYYNQVEEEQTLQNLTAPPFALSDIGVGDVGGHPSFAAPFTSVNPATVVFTSYNGILAPTTNCNGPNQPLCQTSPVSVANASIPNKYPFTPPAAGSNVDFKFFEPMSLNVTDPKYNVPYSVNYNLTIQRELPGKMILSVGYVGAQGRHLQRAVEQNVGINPTGCAADPNCVGNKDSAAQASPQFFKYDGNVFGSIGQQGTDGNSRYNSFQASLHKRVSHGLSFLVSYTWAHSQDNGSGFESSGFGNRGVNPLIPGLNWGDSDFDARQRFVASYQYELPVPHALSSGPVLSRIFKGWRVAGNTTLQTGFAINLNTTNETSLTCPGFNLVFYTCWDNPNQVGPIQYMDPRVAHNAAANNLVPNCAGKKRSGNFYFNPAQVCDAPFGTFGNTGRDSLHGPGLNFTNLALMKDIQIREQMRFELRLETFNTFNHVNFNNLQSSFGSGGSTTNVASSSFGRVTSDSGPRLVQLAGKFYF
jgi:Carboxypeptidase regulatory-like domain